LFDNICLVKTTLKWFDRHAVGDPIENTDYLLDIADGGVNFNRQLKEPTRNPSPATTPTEAG
jgi:hypothetical protein